MAAGEADKLASLDALDEYATTITTGRVIEVERIIAAVAALPQKAFQETLTAALAAELGCEVVTVGYHSGVKTTCRAG